MSFRTRKNSFMKKIGGEKSRFDNGKEFDNKILDLKLTV